MCYHSVMIWISHWKGKAKALKREVYALYLCSRHPDTPFHAKLPALLIVSYALSPVDAIPDFIPVLGYLDDLLLIPLGITLLIKIMPADVLEECRSRAQSASDSKPKVWMGAVIVACVWVFVLCVTFLIIRRIIYM